MDILDFVRKKRNDINVFSLKFEEPTRDKDNKCLFVGIRFYAKEDASQSDTFDIEGIIKAAYYVSDEQFAEVLIKCLTSWRENNKPCFKNKE